MATIDAAREKFAAGPLPRQATRGISGSHPLVMTNSLLKMVIEIVNFMVTKWWIFP